MTAYSDVEMESHTLSGTTQDVVTITGSSEVIEVINNHASVDLWIKWSDTDPGSITAGGDGTRLVLPKSAFGIRRAGLVPTVIRLLGNANPYVVQVVALGMGHNYAYTPFGSDVAVTDGGTGASDAAGARTNLDVQQQHASLDDIAAIVAAEGDLLVFNGTNWVALPDGTLGKVLTANGAGNAPTWETP